VKVLSVLLHQLADWIEARDPKAVTEHLDRIETNHLAHIQETLFDIVNDVGILKGQISVLKWGMGMVAAAIVGAFIKSLFLGGF